MREADIMRREQAKASSDGNRLFRNNVGMLYDIKGVPVKFGLAVGSGDLIGWTKVVITPEMVGKTIAQFTSIEVKSAGGKLRESQERWRDAVREAGGRAEVVVG